MSYIGNTQQNQSYVPAVDFFSGDGSTTAFTLSKPVATTAQIQAVISNVPQTPGVAYTVSGSTITFTSAPPSGTNNIYVYYTSPNTQVVQPGQGTVTTTSIVDASVTPAKLSTGAPTWDTSGNIATTGNIVINNSNADGGQLTLCSAGYDNWNIDSYSGTLRFYNGATVRASIDSAGRVTMPYQPHARVGKNNGNVSSPSTFVWNDVLENIGSCYNSSTGRFTAPIAGNYLLTMQCLGMTSAAAHWMWARKNGSARILTPYDSFTSGAQYTNLSSSTVVALAANDYIDWWIDSGQIYGQDSWQVQMSVTLLG